MFRNRDRMLKFFVWFVVIAMVLTVLAAIGSLVS